MFDSVAKTSTSSSSASSPEPHLRVLDHPVPPLLSRKSTRKGEVAADPQHLPAGRLGGRRGQRARRSKAHEVRVAKAPPLTVSVWCRRGGVRVIHSVVPSLGSSACATVAGDLRLSAYTAHSTRYYRPSRRRRYETAALSHYNGSPIEHRNISAY